MARFKELCMDTDGDAAALASFWAAVVGARAVSSDPRFPDDYDVVGEAEHQGIAVGRVPEAKGAKHRVHLDIYAAATDDLVALGASVALPAEESGFPWTVMRDPDGGEFCAFVKDPLPDYRLHGIVVDSADPEAQARWWGEALGATLDDNDGRGFWTLLGATPDPVMTMDFVPVPEPKTLKNRIHWDVYGTVEEFAARGATRLWDTRGWVVMADPEGNEFCVFAEPLSG
jgi:catechol 2,3-dioxygenase-like lactoylglutathione lyase family enzyme